MSRGLHEKHVYRTITVSAVLYGCETWSLTLRKGRRLRVFENTMLRIIFGPKKDKETGEWRRLHNEEFNDMYSGPLTYELNLFPRAGRRSRLFFP
jgi:hypothetical protein